MYTIEGKYTNALITEDNLESTCLAQITVCVNHPAFTQPIAIMPDAHAGKSCVVGFTMSLGDKIVPEVVGVDIGCGVLAVQTDYTASDYRNKNLQEVDTLVREAIPHGFCTFNNQDQSLLTESFSKGMKQLNGQIAAAERHLGISMKSPVDVAFIEDRINLFGGKKVYDSLGTLGGGNHFIEMSKDSHNRLWVVIHSGSRNFGLQVCTYWQQKAQNKEMGIAWLEGEDALGYVIDMLIAQHFALENRAVMSERVCNVLGCTIQDKLLSTHNYISPYDFIIRKGAVRAHSGDKIIIPMNMRDGSYVCRVISGNENWNYSAPHGAGRILSRGAAKRSLDIAQFQEDMRGIYTGNNPENVLDEAPRAYKNKEVFLKAIAAEKNIEIIEHLKPIHNIKA